VDETVEEQFTEFVRQRGHVLFRAAFALCGQQHAAEDLLQNALAKTVVKWRSLTGEPEHYVRRVLYNDFISGWRHRMRRAEFITAHLPDRPAPGDDAERAVTRLALMRALRSLPRKQRAVLVLRFLEDMSEREAAEVLGCSPGTIASQTSRALAKLRLSSELGSEVTVR
jgi:RNA polymerase sigma-70 factor (sigma-E family)